MFRLPFILSAILIVSSSFFVSCGSKGSASRNEVIVSIKDQKMMLLSQGVAKKIYPVSTSKFGVSSRRGSNHTPLGKHAVARKVGGGAPFGSVFKSRKRTGEILQANAKGRDPVVTRILWLKGLESGNHNTYGRFIYIHGTPEERRIGHPASYGCIRMKSWDVINLYNRMSVGSHVTIIRGSLPNYKISN